MSSSSRNHGQLNLPPGLLPNRAHGPSLLPKEEQKPELVAGEPDALAAELFDHALSAAGITSQEAAYLLDVSESMVRKMRSANARERVSFPQMLRLPVSFHFALHKAMSRRYGFGRAALARALEGLGDLALALEDR